MVETTPKISFIPKASLVHEESFFDRSRSRSAMGILAVLVFSVVAVGYAGLFFYNRSLEKQLVSKLGEVQKVQSIFTGAKEVKSASDFSFRAEIVRQLLDAHVAVSPILKFLSENTVGSIMYDKFSFKQEDGVVTTKLSGEAPTYSALAYQKEILSKKTTELLSSSVSDVSLTQFGTVSFSMTLMFKPGYLSYFNMVQGTSVGSSTPSVATTVAPAKLPQVVNGGVTPQPVPGNGGLGTSFSLPPKITPGTTTGATVPPPATANDSLSTTTDRGAAPAPDTKIAGNSGATSSSPTNTTPAAAPSPSFWSAFMSWFKFW